MELIALTIILLLGWMIFDVIQDQDSFLHGQVVLGLLAFLGIVYASIRLVWIFLHWSIPIIIKAVYHLNQLSGR